MGHNGPSTSASNSRKSSVISNHVSRPTSSLRSLHLKQHEVNEKTFHAMEIGKDIFLIDCLIVAFANKTRRSFQADIIFMKKQLITT